MIRVLLFAVTSVVLLRAAPAFACDRLAATSVAPRGGFVLPANGAHVPSNVRVWLAEETGGGMTPVTVRDSSGALVNLTRSVFTITGEVSSTLTMLTPANPLANGTYSVAVPSSTQSFTVDQPVDSSAPAAPNGTVASGGPGACGDSPPSAVVTLNAAPEAFTMAVADDSVPGVFPTTMFGITTSSSLFAFGVPTGTFKFKLVSVDLAGNQSDASSKTVGIPPQGCSVAGPWLLAWLAPLAVLRSRSSGRRRQSPPRT